SMRASLAAPGVFAPVEIDGRVLVDGGVAENLPVEAVRELGVDVIVAVDVSSPLRPARELGSALAVSQQMVAILINRATERARATLSARDVIVDPDLGALASTDFARVFEALRAGEAGARRVAPQLAALALAPEEYANHVARRAERATPGRVDFVQVDAASGRYRKLIESALAPAVCRPAEGESLDRAIRSLYGRDLFETLDYRVVESGGRTGLEVSARRKGWGPNYLRIGLELQDDFQGDTSYTAGLRFVVTEANPYMAEWNFDLQIGERPRFAVEFFQPLGYASPWFVAPRFAVGSRSLRTETPDGSPLGEYRVRERQYGLDVGRELGTWGEVRAGVRRTSGTTRLQFGTPTPRAPASLDFDGGGWFARFAVDRLDSVSFPRHGDLFQVQWDAERRALGADADVDTARADWLVARSRGRHTLIGWVSGGSALNGTDAVQRFFPLGGFLNLSGLAADSIAGPHFGIGRLVYLNRLRPRGAGPFDVPMYLGVSLEAGNAWERRGDASFADLRRNVGAFFGLETLLGPLYLGGGYDEGGESAYYLFLGRTV
ncbi:MAG: patatin-like phospholipase family protein, partial [Pseudomonadota bacterium]